MGKEIIEVLDSFLSELLGNDIWLDLKPYIKISHGIDLVLQEDVIQKADRLEAFFYDLLGPFAAPVILSQINDKLIKHFSLENSENLRYSSIGDYSKLIKRLVELKVDGGEIT